ncbi:MAG: hypothetical protein K0S07_768 [Chlamydiales bacterium]|jgi:hypothetical protein|nr:hypothetical protein [Chlamydiales bacterium]
MISFSESKAIHSSEKLTQGARKAHGTVAAQMTALKNSFAF